VGLKIFEFHVQRLSDPTAPWCPERLLDKPANSLGNMSNEMLADAIGRADGIVKGAEAALLELKSEFKRRGLLTAAGERFTVTRSDQVSSRLDVAAVKTFLGDSWRRFETATITTVVRIKTTPPQLAAA
jgi:hypothetical protein